MPPSDDIPAVSDVLLHLEQRAARPGHRRGINRLSALTQALDLKTQAYVDAVSEKTPVHVRAALMRAWVDLQEMAMALRGHGKPKPVEARNAQPKRKAVSSAPLVYPTTPEPERQTPG